MKKHFLRRTLVLIFACTCSFLLAKLVYDKEDLPDHALDEQTQKELIPPAIKSRPFFLGFTSWPPSFEMNDIQFMYGFIEEHADIIGHQFDNGIPWQAAYDDTDFPATMMSDWEMKKNFTPAGLKKYLALMPLNEKRAGLALNYAKEGNSPLPPDWANLNFDNVKVKQAFFNYTKRAIEFFEPDYLCLGLEVNLILENQPEKWDAFVDLHKTVYDQLKKIYPNLPVFVSVKYEKLKKARHKQELTKILPAMDILGLSIYPYGEDYGLQKKLDNIPEDFFASALQYAKPIAITETGAPTKTFTAFKHKFTFAEQFQNNFFSFILRAAAENKFIFVINFTSMDFDKLVARMPPEIRDLGTFWAYTGMVNSNRTKKQALAIWDAYLKLAKD